MFAWAIKNWVDPNFIAGKDGFITANEALEDFNKTHWVESSRPKYIAENGTTVFEIVDGKLIPSKEITVKLPKYK